MGMTYIVGISDDTIRDAGHSPEEWERLRYQLGETLLSVCLKEVSARLVFTMMREGSPAFVSGTVGHHVGAVLVSDEVHTFDERLYLWNRDCLKALDKVPEKELLLAEELIAQERLRRAGVN
jgi:hypothetical protein